MVGVRKYIEGGRVTRCCNIAILFGSSIDFSSQLIRFFRTILVPSGAQSRVIAQV